MSIKQGGNTIAGLEDTSGKANVDMDNLTSTGKEVCAHMSMPSGRFINLTVGASGARYDAPADGWFVASSQGVITMSLLGNRSGITVNGAAGFGPWATLPVSKGAYVLFTYSSNQGNELKFYYAEGAE